MVNSVNGTHVKIRISKFIHCYYLTENYFPYLLNLYLFLPKAHKLYVYGTNPLKNDSPIVNFSIV